MDNVLGWLGLYSVAIGRRWCICEVVLQSVADDCNKCNWKFAFKLRNGVLKHVLYVCACFVPISRGDFDVMYKHLDEEAGEGPSATIWLVSKCVIVVDRRDATHVFVASKNWSLGVWIKCDTIVN